MNNTRILYHFRDSLRTGVNCTSHCVAAGIIDKMMGDEIERTDDNVEAINEVKTDDKETKNKEETESFL